MNRTRDLPLRIEKQVEYLTYCPIDGLFLWSFLHTIPFIPMTNRQAMKLSLTVLKTYYDGSYLNNILNENYGTEQYNRHCIDKILPKRCKTQTSI